MNYKYNGYNRLFTIEMGELPDCKLYNRWLRKVIRRENALVVI